MSIKVKVPNIGESVTEAEIAQWLVADGQVVAKDEDIAEIESEKATITISADGGGPIKILVAAGETVKIGAVIAEIDTSAAAATDAPAAKATKESTVDDSESIETEKNDPKASDKAARLKLTPLARRILEEDFDEADLKKIYDNKKLSKKEVLAYLQKKNLRKSTTVKMSMLRRKLSERLVAVKNQTAMLTTFNEVDMSAVMSLRKKHQEAFVAAHNIKLGFMSFFIKAATMALAEFPEVNAAIDGDNIVYHKYADISIAVSTDKGLMVPVVRNAELMSLAEIEKTVYELSEKARTNKISIDEMSGGTFTISNGGVFGSMLSTPLINPPQSAVLGMHNIQQRPVVIDGQIAVRPMMYLALSYDHRIIDGKESVSFVMRLKELLENAASFEKDL